jgi:hypothetical protein
METDLVDQLAEFDVVFLDFLKKSDVKSESNRSCAALAIFGFA